MAAPGSLSYRRRRLRNTSDQGVYSKAVDAAKAYGLDTSKAQPAPSGIARGQAGVERRKELYAGLGRRTTDASRKRLLKRILQGYGAST